MRVLKVAAVLAVAAMLASAMNAAAAAKAKKANKGPITGTITAVKMDEGKDTGTFTVKVTPKQKKGDTTPPVTEEKTFKVTAATKFASASGKGGAVEATAAKFADLAEGKTVVITANGETAENVTIQAAKKKKNK
jgi:hypothetical protein